MYICTPYRFGSWGSLSGVPSSCGTYRIDGGWALNPHALLAISPPCRVPRLGPLQRWRKPQKRHDQQRYSTSNDTTRSTSSEIMHQLHMATLPEAFKRHRRTVSLWLLNSLTANISRPFVHRHTYRLLQLATSTSNVGDRWPPSGSPTNSSFALPDPVGMAIPAQQLAGRSAGRQGQGC